MDECIRPVPSYNKVKRAQFLTEGRYPIISQEAGLINGYWNEPGDVVKLIGPVIVFGDHTRCLKYVDFEFVVGADGVKILNPSPEFEPKFLYYHLVYRDVQELGYARHYKVLSEQEIGFPDRSEQRRIVGILDEAFAGLDAMRANAEKSLAGCRSLVDSAVAAVFVAPHSHWERASLEELLARNWIISHLDGNHGSDYPRKEEFVASGVPYISAKCIKGDAIDMSLAKFLSPERAATIRKGVAIDQDVIFAHNATVGPVAILKTSEKKTILSTSLTYYRCNPAFVIPEYLALYMISSAFTLQYTGIMQQSTRNQVPITKQREFVHLIPPVQEQRDIVRQLSTTREAVDRLVQNFGEKLLALEELRKSLLHQAFSGTL